MKRILSVAFLLTGCAILISLVYIDFPHIPAGDSTSLSAASSTVQIKGRIVRVAIADTPLTREHGLSGRERLESDEGMLFVFDKDGSYAFWMKDMKFPIDILWISREGMVVDVKRNVSPETYPTVFAPRTRARYVLELPAGYTEAYDVRLGDIVRL